MGIRSARLKAGKTVQDVVAALHISDAAVYMWETGRTTPKPKHLKELAKLYSTTIDDLLSEDK